MKSEEWGTMNDEWKTSDAKSQGALACQFFRYVEHNTHARTWNAM
jgi:hypothetical protein